MPVPDLSPAPLPKTPWLRPFHLMAKPAGPVCNLECTYCFYRDKKASPGAAASSALPGNGGGGPAATERQRPFVMSPATAEVYVRDYLASQPNREVEFAWQGGEPTLAGLEFFQGIIALQRRYGAGRTITNALQTNGTLLDDRWCEFLAREHFLVGVSVDGPKPMHDAYRVDRGGRPSWDKVMRGIRLLKKHRVEFNTLTVLHRRNVRQAAQVYEFLRTEGSGFMQFIPLVERRPSAAETARGMINAAPRGLRAGLVSRAAAEQEVIPECAAPERIGEFLTTVFDTWVRRDVGRIFVQLFDVTLAAWVNGSPGLCTFEPECGRALALEHNGDVFACDHYVYPEYRWGNLHDTALADIGHGPQAARFGSVKADLPRICRECPVRFACNGDCPKHRFVAAGEGEPGVSYLCPAYRKFFTHVAPAMERMAALVKAGRPASDVLS